ncbi:hypothetical protein RHMOL_Rhmol10G0155100 [Rhododendron molle]|uniref:Uncharacterized protein n=1 Tax=Rhododendron molle TaxID=49168 RepID=A0ACC0M3R8_RHOML|nr:hypothetical protein RHMOL_Rhmol10G0155100 [Rhododendron molle]
MLEEQKNASASTKNELSHVGTMDNSSLDICHIKLDGTNYLNWSRTFTLAIEARGMLEKERVYDFLAGLDIEYDQIRVHVLGYVPFPSLGEAYAIVQQEESMRGATLHTPTFDRFALVAIPQGQFGSSSGLVLPQSGKSQSGTNSGPIDRESLWCDYCNNTGHTREKLSDGLICMPFVRLKDQVARIFTPSCSSWCEDKLGLIDIFAPT